MCTLAYKFKANECQLFSAFKLQMSCTGQFIQSLTSSSSLYDITFLGFVLYSSWLCTLSFKDPVLHANTLPEFVSCINNCSGFLNSMLPDLYSGVPMILFPMIFFSFLVAILTSLCRPTTLSWLCDILLYTLWFDNSTLYCSLTLCTMFVHLFRLYIMLPCLYVSCHHPSFSALYTMYYVSLYCRLHWLCVSCHRPSLLALYAIYFMSLYWRLLWLCVSCNYRSLLALYTIYFMSLYCRLLWLWISCHRPSLLALYTMHSVFVLYAFLALHSVPLSFFYFFLLCIMT